MAEEVRTPLSTRTKLLYGLLTLVVLLILGFVIESCEAEKVEICDASTGECEFSSTCRPLILDLL